MQVTAKDINTLLVGFQFDPMIVTEIKKILPPSARKWNPDLRRWELHLQGIDVSSMEQFFTKCPADFNPPAKKLYESLVEQFHHFSALSRSDATAIIDIPGFKRKLFPFQFATTSYLIAKKRVFNCDDMGLGKTTTSIAAVHYLRAYPSLVVTKAKFKYDFAKEYNACLSEPYNIAVISTKGADWYRNSDEIVESTTDVEAAIATAQIVVINYDILDRFQDAFVQRNWQSVLLDEFHMLTNRKAGRTKTTSFIVKPWEKETKTLVRPAIPVRIMMSGYPINNSPGDAIKPLMMLDRLEEFGGWFYYVNRYCNFAETHSTKDANATTLPELHAKLRSTCYVRHRKEDVLPDLPAKQRIPIYITMEAKYRKLYDKAREEFLKEVSMARGIQRFAAMDKMLQIVGNAKLAAACDWISEFFETEERKLVVFAHHINIQKALLEHCQELNLNPARIFGQDTGLQVSRDKKRFQEDPNCRIIVCSLKAGAETHTLHAASDALITEFWWTASTMEQAEARIHRIGQNNAAMIYYLIAHNTDDHDLLKAINWKAGVASGIMEGEMVDLTEERFLKYIVKEVA